LKCFLQGMRRSGTTIVFDILSQDDRLDMWYEPLSLGRVGALGGGSGVQPTDLMTKVREARAEFLAGGDHDGLSSDDLNFGAPTNPKLELKARLTRPVREYLEFLLAKCEHSVCKFTRAYRKMKSLRRIRPDARVVVLVRHPRDVVASYMYGRDRKLRNRYPDRDSFFRHRGSENQWSSRKLVTQIARRDSRPEFLELPNWERCLVLWKYTLDHTLEGARTHFGDAVHLLRHEDLGAAPRRETARLYAHLGLPPSEAALEWAEQNVRPRPSDCYDDDDRWPEAFDRLGLGPSMRNAGYAPDGGAS